MRLHPGAGEFGIVTVAREKLFVLTKLGNFRIDNNGDVIGTLNG